MNNKIPQYGLLDFFKFICAILIVIAHYVTENADGRINSLIEYGVSIYIVVVPFFFTSSGFLLYKKIYSNPQKEDEIVLGYIKRILRIYISWSLIYFCFKLITWLKFGTTISDVMYYIMTSITYSTYATIWFLPALIIGVGITCLLIRNIGTTKTIVIGIIAYLIGTVGVSYDFIITNKFVWLNDFLELYNFVFVSFRNGIFNGFPFVLLGALIAKKFEKDKVGRPSRYFIFMIVYGMAFMVEAVLIKTKFNAVNVNTLLCLIPFTYFFVCFCISVPIASNKILRWMRKISTMIFVSQRIYLTALPTLFPNSFFKDLLSGNPYIGCIYILSITIITAEVLLITTNRNKKFLLC